MRYKKRDHTDARIAIAVARWYRRISGEKDITTEALACQMIGRGKSAMNSLRRIVYGLPIVVLLSCSIASGATLSFAWGQADIGTTGYNLYGVLGSVTNRLGFTTGIDSTNITVNVSPNGNWKFQATAIYGDVGESAPNAALTVFVQAAPAPSVFQPLTTRVGSTYNASISWSSALHDYYVTNYIARLTKQGITQTVTTTATSTTFTGLTAGRYDFSVVGVNMTGEGLPGLRSFNITGGPPGPLKLIQ